MQVSASRLQRAGSGSKTLTQSSDQILADLRRLRLPLWSAVFEYWRLWPRSTSRLRRGPRASGAVSRLRGATLCGRFCDGQSEPFSSSRLGRELTFTCVQQQAKQSGDIDSEFCGEGAMPCKILFTSNQGCSSERPIAPIRDRRYNHPLLFKLFFINKALLLL